MASRRCSFVFPLAAVLLVTLAGCVAESSPVDSTTSPTATSSPTSATPTPTAATTSPTAGAQVPASDAVLTVSLDGGTMAGSSTNLPLSREGVDTWIAALGAAPKESQLDGPYGPPAFLTVFEWTGMKLTVPADESASGGSLYVSAPTVAGHPVLTPEGIGIGSTRAEALAAGAVDGFDSTNLRLDIRDVPGTHSLERDGEVGREFILLILEGDSVVSTHIPGNDYSDI